MRNGIRRFGGSLLGLTLLAGCALAPLAESSEEATSTESTYDQEMSNQAGGDGGTAQPPRGE